MEAKTVFFYLIVAIAIAALIIAIVAAVQSNNNGDNIKSLQSQAVNYTALNYGNTKLLDESISPGPNSKVISITLPTDKWAYTGYNLGVLGSIYISTSAAANIVWTATYTKNGGAEEDLIGALDYTTQSIFNVNLNGVATGTNGVIKKDDVIVIYLNANSSSLTPVTIGTNPQDLNAAIVYGPVGISS
jgi:hypothetical protein